MYKFRASCNILSVAQLAYRFCYYKMGRHLQVTCRICLKTMRSDHLKRHMKQHEKKPYSIDEVTEKIDYHSTVDDVALKNEIVRGGNEYRRRLELGREVKRLYRNLLCLHQA